MAAYEPVGHPLTASVGSCPACGGDLLAGDRFCGGCGAPVPQPEDTELLVHLQRATLAEHEIQGILGRGGMGLVYLAHDVALNRKVAIKVLPLALLQGDAAVERFRREARIAASLRHRHITSVFGLKETSQVVFFIMEYVEGRTLDAILRDEGPLAIDVVEAILLDAASALSYAHRHDVVHRDLKPANIIVDVEGMAMITDFGVAKVSTAQGLTSAGSTVGSPKYMSPEQWSGKATSLSDQYALGCVAYELLAGRPPFQGESIAALMKQQLFDAPRPLGELRADCPPALVEGLGRMLEKDPADRWPSLEAAIAALGLRPLSADAPARLQLARFAKRGHDVRALPRTPQSPIPVNKVLARPAPPPERAPPLRRPIPWAAAAVVVVVVGGGAYAVHALRRAAETRDGIAIIEITDAPTTLAPGERAPIVARAKNARGELVASVPIVWSSTDPAVAFPSADSVVTAIGVGSATLTASGGGRSASVRVLVAPASASVAALRIVPAAVRLAAGDSARLTATAEDRSGQLITGRPLEWTSSAPGVVLVSATGQASAVAPGTAIVTASADGKTAQATVTVVPAGIASLDVRPARSTIRVSQSERLSAFARDASGKSLGARTPEWISSNPAVAAVSSTGIVTGLAAGSARITALTGGATSAPVTVTVTGVGAPAPAVLQLLVTPWAFVSIDGVPHGQLTRLVDTLRAGVGHRVHFEHSGFAAVDTAVTLEPGEARLLRIQLTPRNP